MNHHMNYAAEAAEQQTEYELVKEWGALYYTNFTWHTSYDSTATVRCGPFRTPEEGHGWARDAALRSGYRSPKWWEYWRWGEMPLPEAAQ